MTLRARVMSGLFWVGGTRLIGQVLTWAITIVVVRLLTPGDYGLLAMATVFMGFLSLVAEAGMGLALIQSPKLDDETLRRIFGVVILVNCVLFALQFVSAPLVAKFFDEERLVPILRVLAIQFLLMIFAVIPGALLTRKLDFKRQSMIGLVGSVLGSLTSLALALAGHGVWALVWSSLVAMSFTMIALNLIEPFLRRPEFSLRGTRRLVVVGGQVTAARALYFVYSQADVFIGGRIFGKDLLGFYSISLHLASLPVQKISSVVNQIAFPAFAEAQHDTAAVPWHMLKGIRLLSFLSFPVLWGISSIAPEIVAVLLGPKWEAATVPLQLLPLVMPITILSPFLNTAFQGIGKTGVVLWNATTACAILPAAYWIGAHWGLLGMSLAWLIGFPLVFYLNLRRMLPIVGLKLSAVLGAAAWPAVAAIVMYACVMLTRHLLVGTMPQPALMTVLIAAGALGYVAMTFATNRRGVQELIQLFRKQPAPGKP
jgi:O-antigen/teichoic acid export membrane protein